MKTKKITLQMFSDPGHGWVRFPKKRLAKLGIADQISTYSYQNGDNAFLEEDCDLIILCDALTRNGYEITFKSGWTNRRSKIRNFDYYKA